MTQAVTSAALVSSVGVNCYQCDTSFLLAVFSRYNKPLFSQGCVYTDYLLGVAQHWAQICAQ